jgi:hypothetical protein
LHSRISSEVAGNPRLVGASFSFDTGTNSVNQYPCRSDGNSYYYGWIENGVDKGWLLINEAKVPCNPSDLDEIPTL